MRRMMVADAHALCRMGVRAVIRADRDFTLSEADCFEEVVSADIDIVIIDSSLPGLNGTDGVRLLRTAKREEIFGFLMGGAHGLALKQCAHIDLAKTVARVMSGEVVVPPMVCEGVPSLNQRHVVVGGLTMRQREVLAQLRLGKSNKHIARELGLSLGTVKIHVSAIFKHFGVSNRISAMNASLPMY